MQPKKHNDSKDYSKLIDESIANAEERRKQTLEEKTSLSSVTCSNRGATTMSHTSRLSMVATGRQISLCK